MSEFDPNWAVSQNWYTLKSGHLEGFDPLAIYLPPVYSFHSELEGLPYNKLEGLPPNNYYEVEDLTNILLNSAA